jgi:branched-chain amino acid transport system permease protein
MTRRVATTTLLVVAAWFMVIPAAFAADAQDEGGSLTTTITQFDEEGERIPAEGVVITVTDSEGNEVGSGATDAEGIFLLEVDSIGTYEMFLDEATLPEGVTLRIPDRNPASVRIDNPGQIGRTIFATDSGQGLSGINRSGVTMRQVLQLTLEGLKLGLFIGMAAIGLSLIFGTTGLTNFAHGEMVGFGLLMAYFFNVYGLAGAFGFLSGGPAPFGEPVNLMVAAVVAVILGGALGWLMDWGIFARLRRRGVGLFAQMVITIGLSLVLRYVFLFAFGGNPRFYRQYTAQSAIDIWILQITPKDLLAAGITIIVLVAVGLFMIRSRYGKAMRAVADNRDLSESSGIDVQRVIRVVWTMGGSLAALGGVFIGLSEQVAWNTGFRILLLMFAGVVLGGIGTAFGALVGSVIVGIGIQVSTIWFPTELKNVGALVLLILALVVRPQGILGRKERVG